MAYQKAISAAAQAARQSTGRLFDVLPSGPLAAASSRASLLGPLRSTMRKQSADWATYWARSRVETQFPDFSAKLFEQEIAPDTYQAFHMYYVRGDEEALKEVCTGPMFMSAKAGLAASQRAHGAVLGFDVLSLLEPVKVVQARVIYGDSLTRSISQMPHPTHFQLTARLVTRELPVSLPLPKGEGKGSKSRRGRAGRSGQGSGGPPPGTPWRPVADPSSGHVYYWNEGSGSVEWEAPSVLGSVGADTPFNPATAPAELEELPDDAAAGGTPTMRAVSYVTWERGAAEGSVWQIAGWMP